MLKYWSAERVGLEEFCTWVHDVIGQLMAEVADSERRLRADVADTASECGQDRRFERNQMKAFSRHKEWLSRQLIGAQSELGNLQERARLRDQERGRLNDKAFAFKAQCRKDIDALLRGKLCGLQRVR